MTGTASTRPATEHGPSSSQVYKVVGGSPYGEQQLMLAAKKQGRTSALRAAIKQHRKTWVTEANFRLAASQGINAVRVPVGYWVMAGATWQVTHRCAAQAPWQYLASSAGLTVARRRQCLLEETDAQSLPGACRRHQARAVHRRAVRNSRAATAREPGADAWALTHAESPCTTNPDSSIDSSQAAPFVEGGYKYLDLAMTWGSRYGIGVLIDLHAAPGSQV